MTILNEAAAATSGDRQREYGHPQVNHQRTADAWQWYLENRADGALTAADVCYLNILQKISRSMQTTTRDTLTDIAGYARNIEMLGEQPEPDYAPLEAVAADAARAKSRSQAAG